MPAAEEKAKVESFWFKFQRLDESSHELVGGAIKSGRICQQTWVIRTKIWKDIERYRKIMKDQNCQNPGLRNL